MNGKLRGNNGGGANCESVWLVRVRVDGDGGDKPHHAEHEKVDGKKLGDLNIYEVYFLPATRFILRFFFVTLLEGEVLQTVSNKISFQDKAGYISFFFLVFDVF